MHDHRAFEVLKATTTDDRVLLSAEKAGDMLREAVPLNRAVVAEKAVGVMLHWVSGFDDVFSEECLDNLLGWLTKARDDLRGRLP